MGWEQTMELAARIRIPIEGMFGIVKHKYNLERVKTKLNMTSDFIIALVRLGDEPKKDCKESFCFFLWLCNHRNICLVLI